MVADHRLIQLYNEGHRISHLDGLKAVWDAAQLEILESESDVTLQVPDSAAKADLKPS